MEITFNTGRHYSPEGQIVKATEFGTPYEEIDFFDPETKADEQYIVFEDVTRQIKGKIIFCKLTEMEIMYRYDKGDYTHV